MYPYYKKDMQGMEKSAKEAALELLTCLMDQDINDQ